MDVFRVHERLIGDYARFTRSFVDIADKRIAATVEEAVDAGLLWPDPWVQLNPNFQPGGTPDDLVAEGLLHDECSRVFRAKSHQADFGRQITLHRHQVEAIQAARAGVSYVLTTGTGSGKSLTYLVPIVDRVLREGSGRGIRAIVVYPMNALANSQSGELEKFLGFGYPPGGQPVTFARYTGQESDEERERITTDPPDILLTNYVMLELLLTRPRERQQLIRAAQGRLRFLVLDELHTYRGRQGSDVAMLVRRVRQACRVPTVQVVGTSATMASGGSEAQQRQAVAHVASQLFGAEVRPEHVVGETLRRLSPPLDLADGDTNAALAARAAGAPPPVQYEDFLADPLVRWIEGEFGLAADAATGALRRGQPRTISGGDGAAAHLAHMTGVDAASCADAIRDTLLAGFRTIHPEDRRPVFAFRLHQFLTKGDTVYATLEPEGTRFATVEAQTYKPGERDKVLLPLAFCRECGEEYYTVTRFPDGTLLPRDIGERGSGREDQATPGFLHLDADRP